MKVYLGEGISVELIDDIIILYTDTNKVYLSQAIFSALIRWIEGLEE